MSIKLCTDDVLAVSQAAWIHIEIQMKSMLLRQQHVWTRGPHLTVHQAFVSVMSPSCDDFGVIVVIYGLTGVSKMLPAHATSFDRVYII